MTTTIRVNGTLLHSRINQSGYQLRDFATLTGVGEASLRTITRTNRLNRSINIGTVYRVLEEAGVTAGEFFDLNTPGPSVSEGNDDAATLAQVLHHDGRMHTKDKLCLALGWHRPRMDDALKDLHTKLSAVGLRVHSNSNGVAIRAADQRGDEAIVNLRRIRDSDRGLNNAELRALYQAKVGQPLSTQSLEARRLLYGALVNRNYVTLSDGAQPRLTPDVAYAFDVDESRTNASP